MDELKVLYQEVILDHSRRPRHFEALPHASHRAEGYNPLCGDRVTVFLDIVEGKVAALSFQGSGCAISTASASMMTEILKGKTVAEAEKIFSEFHQLLTRPERAIRESPLLEKLSVFAGVREFPMRVKCATLAWHTLKAALARQQEPVMTE